MYPEGIKQEPASDNEMQKYESMIGKRFFVRPIETSGKDGQKHNVITYLAGGRGWFSRKAVATVDLSAEIEVEVVLVNSHNKYRFAEVRIVNGADTAILGEFIKTPYKKANGTLNPTIQCEYYKTFNKAYGIGKPVKQELHAQMVSGAIEYEDSLEDYYVFLIELKYLLSSTEK